MLICKNIKNELNQIIQDTGFLEFISSQEKINMFNVSENLPKNAENSTEIIATIKKKDDFYITIDLATNEIINLIYNSSDFLKYFSNFKYLVTLLTIQKDGSDILVLKADSGLKYFQNFFKHSIPFDVSFSNEVFTINNKSEINVDFSLNSEELKLIKEYIKTMRGKSILIVMCTLKKIMENQDLEILAFEPNGEKISINIIFNIFKLKFAQEIYNILY